jgi:hypothetical protein
MSPVAEACTAGDTGIFGDYNGIHDDGRISFVESMNLLSSRTWKYVVHERIRCALPEILINQTHHVQADGAHWAHGLKIDGDSFSLWVWGVEVGHTMDRGPKGSSLRQQRCLCELYESAYSGRVYLEECTPQSRSGLAWSWRGSFGGNFAI